MSAGPTKPLGLNPERASDLETFPQPGAVDYFAQIMQLGISAIPDWGGPASQLFGMIAAPLLAQRRDTWFEELRAQLNEMSRRVEGLTIQALAHNEQFVDAILQAMPLALRTGQQEKREALRNAVLKVAAGNAPEQDLQSIFFNLVDEFTPTHLQALRLFEHSDAEVRARLAAQRDLTDQAVLDLNRRGLVRDPRPYVAQNRPSSFALVTLSWELTSIGSRFLRFIARPV